MHCPLPEVSLDETASDVNYIERETQFNQTTPVSLGPGFCNSRHDFYFRSKDTSSDVRNFTIDDVCLHTASMVLVRHGCRIKDTRYLLPQARYDAVQIDPTGMVELESGPAYVLARSFDNWYHWLTQTLPTIDHAIRGGAAGHLRILLHPLQRRWQRETLKLLGYDEIPRIDLDSQRNYHIPRVQYLEFMNGKTSFGVSLSALDTYRRLREAVPAPPFSGPRMIYVVRTDTAQCRMENEADIIACMEQAGVTPIIPGQLSLAEQINLFHGVDAVIGSHGAALANVAFCRPGTILHELHPQHDLNPSIARLAQTAGLRYLADVFPSDAAAGPHDKRWAPETSRLLQRVEEIKALLPRACTAPTARPAIAPPEDIRLPLVLPQEMLAIPGQHRKAIAQALRMESTALDAAASPRILFVCFTNRAGSNLLCERLSATGHFNTAQEMFNSELVLTTCQKENLPSFGAYFTHIATKGQKNGIFVVKVAADHVVALAQAGILDRLIDRSLFVWSRRDDKLDQAISLSIAAQNQQWSSHVKPAIPASALQYSAWDIADKIRWITVQEYGLAAFFAVNGIRPATMEYDQVVRHPQEVVDGITRRIGIPNLRMDPGKQRLQKQGGSVNAAWRVRFLSEPYPTGPRPRPPAA